MDYTAVDRTVDLFSLCWVFISAVDANTACYQILPLRLLSLYSLNN
jgi:hypothetical protein